MKSKLTARLTEAARQLTPNLNTDKPSDDQRRRPGPPTVPPPPARDGPAQFRSGLQILLPWTAARGYFADTSPIPGVAAKGQLCEDRCDRATACGGRFVLIVEQPRPPSDLPRAGWRRRNRRRGSRRCRCGTADPGRARCRRRPGRPTHHRCLQHLHRPPERISSAVRPVLDSVDHRRPDRQGILHQFRQRLQPDR